MAVRTPLKLGASNNLQQMSAAEINAVQEYCQYLYWDKWSLFNGGVHLVVDFRSNYIPSAQGTYQALNTKSSRFQTRAGLVDSYRLAGTTVKSKTSFGSPSNDSSIQANHTNDYLFKVNDNVTSEPNSTLMDTGNNFTYPLFYNGGNLQAMSRQDMYDTFIFPAINGSGSTVNPLTTNGYFYTASGTATAISGYTTAPYFFCNLQDLAQKKVQTNLSTTQYSGRTSGNAGGTMFPGYDATTNGFLGGKGFGINPSSSAFGSAHTDGIRYRHESSAMLGNNNSPTIFRDYFTNIPGGNNSSFNVWDTVGSTSGDLFSIAFTGNYNLNFSEWQLESPRAGSRSSVGYHLHKRNSNPFSTTSSTLPMHTTNTGDVRATSSSTWKTTLENMMCWVTSNVSSYRLDFNYNTAISGTQQGSAILDTARAAELLEFEITASDDYLAGFVPKGAQQTQNTYTLTSRLF